MFKRNLDELLARNSISGSQDEYKESKDESSDNRPKEESDEETSDLSRDPDLGHLEAERIIEKQRLEKLLAPEEAKYVAKAEAEAEENREDLIRTNRRF